MSLAQRRRTVDVVCRVVDNFGDAAVAWRLARGLALDQGFRVRLLIDRLDVLKKLVPELCALPHRLHAEGVDVEHCDPFSGEIAEIVLETFACGLPAAMTEAMHKARTAWLNIEYLSAEQWVEGCHGLPSPRGSDLPTCYYFFPGFTARTGGILREPQLRSKRLAFQADPGAIAHFWARLCVLPPRQDELRVSFFVYPHGWPDDFFLVLAAICDVRMHVLVAEGVMPEAVSRYCGSARAGSSASLGALTVTVLPFMSQSEFDRLLWSCDMNVVRGEDSFVRAQLSARPMLWDIYPQASDVHLVKLSAFLQRYTAAWPQDVAALERDAALALCRRDTGLAATLMAWARAREALAPCAQSWAEVLESLPELAQGAGQFARKLLE